MLSSCRFAPSAALVALVLILGGCAGVRHPPGPAGAAADSSGKGIYKVGKPYQIDGAWYYPAEDWNYNETGIASWYGEAFHGKDIADPFGRADKDFDAALDMIEDACKGLADVLVRPSRAGSK